ncbi:MAG: hypothetical protein ACTSU5_16300 [Promethearchaeota archaeon]
MRSSGFRIVDDDLEMRVSLVPVNSLTVHEEVIEASLSRLVLQIRNWGVIKDPIIVDSEHYIILDGNHRAAAFRQLGYSYIPACVVPYDNPRILLRRWFRRLEPPEGVDDPLPSLLKTFDDIGLELAQVDSGAILREKLAVVPDNTVDPDVGPSENNPVAGVYIPWRGVFYEVTSNASLDLVEVYDKIQSLEKAAEEVGFSVGYFPDDKLTEVSGECGVTRGVLIMTPTIGKADVIRSCLRGRVFARKSTRHLIPARPLNAAVPISWLKKPDVSLRELNERLVEFLERKKVRVLPPGQVFEGRVYSEKLFVFTGS